LPREIDAMIIRPLTVYEREAVRQFYLALVPDDRRKRFCCSLSDETISSYVDRLDFSRDTILAAFDEHARVIGLAELVRGAGAGEMAFSVLPDRRGQRIGTKLLERLLLRARICGIRRVFVMFLSDNTPMRRMASRAGMAVSSVDGESHAERDLPAASADDLARWLIEEGFSHSGYFGTLGIARWGSLVNPCASTAPESLGAIVPAA
jgi:GNAT superfamily N-acetyltransferase